MAKKKEKAGPDPQGWMLSFSDLLTNMLTFFVLIYSMGSMDNLKFEYILSPALRGALGGLDRGKLSGIEKPRFISAPALPSEEFALIEDAVVQALLQNTQERFGDGSKLFSQNFQAIEVYANNKYAQILFPTRILFAKDSAKILPQMAQQLDGIAEILRKFAHPVRINGYGRSSAEAGGSINLSLRRAASVLDFLVTEGGLAPERCSLAGYGSLRNEERRGKNEDYVEVFVIKATSYET